MSPPQGEAPEQNSALMQNSPSTTPSRDIPSNGDTGGEISDSPSRPGTPERSVKGKRATSGQDRLSNQISISEANGRGEGVNVKRRKRGGKA
ncbi:hypothetical protein PG985_014044 [Apiospora marii]|uniref:Uncharacterized protein n=1 Tax=Apiospora marii TaxID=335849 RepID=A0ABR1R618_9PEZI